MEDFCQQYGHSTLTGENKAKTKSNVRPNRSTFYKRKNLRKKKSSQEPNKPIQKAKGFKRVPTCYKCGKKGHYNNKCITKAKINAITDEGLKRQLLATFINVSDSDYEDNYSEKTYSKSKALR